MSRSPSAARRVSTTGSGVSGGSNLDATVSLVDLDKRLQWFEQRIDSAFRLSVPAFFASRHQTDVRKLFDDDDVRRDITSFCESDACRILLVFMVPNGAGGFLFRLTASVADPEIHRANKILCFRKLVSSLKAIGSSAVSATAASASALPLAAGSPQQTGSGSAVAPGKISHENIHRYVSFFEMKPHMLRCIAHMVRDVIVPISQAVVNLPAGADVDDNGTSIEGSASSAGHRRASVSPAASNAALGGGSNSVVSAGPAVWGGASCPRLPYPPPVKRGLEQELQSLAQGALVASGVVEGRTLLPRVHVAADAVERSAAAPLPGTLNIPAPLSGPNASKRSSTVSFDPSFSAASDGSVASGPRSLAAAEQLAAMWLPQLRKLLSSNTPFGSNEKRIMASGSAFRFVPISPHEEIVYWRGRSDDLTHVVLQLQTSTFQDTLAVLEAHHSHYFDSLRLVSDAVRECQDDATTVCRWLTPLLPFFDALSLTSPSRVELPNLVTDRVFLQLFHLLYLLWSKCPSPTYPSSSRLASIIAGVAEHLVTHCREFLSLDMYFLSDTHETRRRIGIVFHVVNHFKMAFLRFKTKAAETVHPPNVAEAKSEWRASSGQLFAHLDLMLERCNDILALLEQREHMEWLTQQNVSAADADALRQTIADVASRQRAAMIEFSQTALDCVCARGTAFEDLGLAPVRAVIEDTMERLGREIVADARNAPFGAHLITRLHLLMRIVNLPVMKRHGFSEQVVSTVCQRWNEEIRMVQQVHVENQYHTFVVAEIPRQAKSLIFSLAVFRRLYELQVVVKTLLDEPYVNQEAEDLQEVLLLYNATCQRVGATFEAAFRTWANTLGEVISRLNTPLLSQHPHSGSYYVALDPHVSDALREVGMVLAVLSQPLVSDAFAHLQMPEEARVLLEMKAAVWRRQVTLQSTLEDYEDTLKEVLPGERGVIYHELGSIDALLRKGSQQFNWEDDASVIDAFIASLVSAVRTVEGTLMELRQPLKSVEGVLSLLVEEEAKFLPIRSGRAGMRSMSLDDCLKRLQAIEDRRKELIDQAVGQLLEIPEQTLARVNVAKGRSGAPALEVNHPAFRSFCIHAVQRFWTAVNSAVASALDHLAKQLNTSWMAENDGLALLDAKCFVHTPKPPAGSTDSARATVTTAELPPPSLQITPDVDSAICPLVSRMSKHLKDMLDYVVSTLGKAFADTPPFTPLSTSSQPHSLRFSDGSITPPVSVTPTNARRAPPSAAQEDDSSKILITVGSGFVLPTTLSRHSSRESVSPVPTGELEPAPPSPEVVVRQWLRRLLGQMKFSPDYRLLELQKVVEAELRELTSRVGELTAPLVEFEALWSTRTITELRARLRRGTALVFGMSIDNIRSEMQAHRALVEKLPSLPSFVHCGCLFRLDLRGIKHTMSLQYQSLQTFLLDHVYSRITSTVDEMESYLSLCMQRLESAGPLLDTKQQVQLKSFFEMLRTIRRRYVEESSVFLPMFQGIRILGNVDHTPKQELQWLTQRIEALQPRWEALYHKSVGVRSQLSSVQDAETTAMRRQAALLTEELVSHCNALRKSALFQPVSLDTNEQGLLEVPAAWDTSIDGTSTSLVLMSPASPDGINRAASFTNASSAQQQASSVVFAFSKGAFDAPMCDETRDIYVLLDLAMQATKRHAGVVASFQQLQELFEIAPSTFSQVSEATTDLQLAKQVWDITIHYNTVVHEWLDTRFESVDAAALLEECRFFSSAYATLPARVREWPVFRSAEKRVLNMLDALPLVQDLRSTALRPRHWRDLSVAALGRSTASPTAAAGAGSAVVAPASAPFAGGGDVLPAVDGTEEELMIPAVASDAGSSPGSSVVLHDEEEVDPSHVVTVPSPDADSGPLLDPSSPDFTLGTLLRLELHEVIDFVRKLVERAEKEQLIERSLERISAFWKTTAIPFVLPSDAVQSAMLVRSLSGLNGHAVQRKTIVTDAPKSDSNNCVTTDRTPVCVLGPTDELVEALDEHLSVLSSVLNSRWADVFRRTAGKWQLDLRYVEGVVTSWNDVQRSLLNLYPIFARSEDLRITLPTEADAFDLAAEVFFSVAVRLQQAHQSTPAVEAFCGTSVTVSTEGLQALRNFLPASRGGSSAQSPTVAFGGIFLPTVAVPSGAEEGGADAFCVGRSSGLPPPPSSSSSSVTLHLLAAIEIVLDVVSVCEQRLGTFLEAKRRKFPRFYFVSDVDLIDILSKEHHPPSVCAHIHQLMSAVERVEFSAAAPDDEIVALHSVEGEVLSLSRSVRCMNRPVEVWLDEVLVESRVAVREAIFRANAAYLDRPRTDWMFWRVAQAVLVVARAQWTAETASALEQVENGSLSALSDHGTNLRNQLARTVETILLPITHLQRRLLISLITIDVHARDVVAELQAKKIDTPMSFSWQSQLRFYLKSHNNSGAGPLALGLVDTVASTASPTTAQASAAINEASLSFSSEDRCIIDICDASFVHALDYTGNCQCLVITPLTDRCYITLTQAMKLCKGGAPAGPAGTGKTETVKDAAHALGSAVYVFNCSDQMDVVTVGNIFKGLAMSGAWGCFDEFNRIAVEVLSVVAAQVKALLDAKRRNAAAFRLLGGDEVDIPILPSANPVGVFITMNPGYKGRTELPENVKSLFRPCAMVTPDVGNIAEILLCAEGFGDSKELSRKFVRLYELSADVLSPEAHYDWGLRAIRAVLLIAGSLKRQLPMHDERALLMQALRDANLAKLTTNDAHMYERLLTALFPNVDVTKSASRDVDLERAVHRAMTDNGYQRGTDKIFSKKILQFHDLLVVRHSVFVMGAAGSGKSAIIRAAKSAFETVNDARIFTETFDPKSMSAQELYGYVHPLTREWRDGVFSRVFREFAVNGQSRYRNSLSQWIILDGSIDADWIESMNSVMDDNRLLTLVNNERISMTPSMRLIFEITHLDNATPATVSRAGILYLNKTDVGWTLMKDRWMQFQAEEARTLLDPLFDKHYNKFLQFMALNATTSVVMNPVAHLRCTCNLLEAILRRPDFANMGEITAPHNYERVFLWACIWSFGLALPPAAGASDFRTVFSSFVKREFVSIIKLPEGTTVFQYDLYMNPDSRDIEFRPWRRIWPLFSDPQKEMADALSDGAQGVVEDSDARAAELSLLLTGSREALDARAVECLNPFSMYSAYVPLRTRFVPVAETTASVKLLATLLSAEKHILVVGEAGCGKSAFVNYMTQTVGPLLRSSIATQHEHQQQLSSSPIPKTTDVHSRSSTQHERVNSLGMFDDGDHNSALPSVPSSPRIARSGSSRSSPRQSLGVPLAKQFHAETVLLHVASNSVWLQHKVDRWFERRSGRQFSPVVGKRLIVVLENLNLPSPDAYGSQSAHCLVRQVVEHGYWYDRQKLTPKTLNALQWIGVMNPNGGTKEVSDRLAHKLFLFGYHAPSSASASQILTALVAQALCEANVSHQLRNTVQLAVAELPDLLDQVCKIFHPAVESFHYSFSLRDLLRIVQGLSATSPATPEFWLPSLWVHEAMCAFGDRLVSLHERERCKNLVLGKARGIFSASVGLEYVLGEKPLPLFTPFLSVEELPEGGFPALPPPSVVPTREAMIAAIHSKLRGRANASNLVLFDEALDTVCRLSRILSQPGGNAILVGLGGSGKRSLVRLAAELTCFRVHSRDAAASVANAGSFFGKASVASPTSGVGDGVATLDVKAEFSKLLQACAVKNHRIVVLLTQSDLEQMSLLQTVDELLTHYSADVFTADEKATLAHRMSAELRSQGHPLHGHPSACWAAFRHKIANNLRIICTVSPFLKTMKPLLRSCAGFAEAQLIFVHEWPQQALHKVASRIFATAHPGPVAGDATGAAVSSDEEATAAVRSLTPSLRESICTFLASTHRLVSDAVEQVRKYESRDVYVTPKTFLTFAQQAQQQLFYRRDQLEAKRSRLRLGLDRLDQCSSRVATLQVELHDYKRAVQQQAMIANNLLVKVNAERQVVEDQNRIAQTEHRKTQKIVDEVNALVEECEADIRAAQPIVDAARAALNTLNRPNLTELKSMNNPPNPVQAVTGCVMCLLAHPNRIPQDRSWAASRRMMTDVPRWMKALEELDVNHIPDPCVDAILTTVGQEWFNATDIIRVSFAASSLCAWVVNVVKYHHIRVMLRPKEARLAEAQQRLASSQAQARKVQDKCDHLQARLDALVSQCDAAQAERDRLEALLLHTEQKLLRAQRLIASLADERGRWSVSLELTAEERLYVDGDTLIATAFATYCGPLLGDYRERLFTCWKSDLTTLGLACSDSLDFVGILFGASEEMVWENEGLSSAKFMAQNAAITLTSPRWPLAIDPQHEALRWLKGRAAARGRPCTMLHCNDPDLAVKLVACVTEGHITLVELGTSFDIPPILASLVEKRYYYKTVKQSRRGSQMSVSVTSATTTTETSQSPPRNTAAAAGEEDVPSGDDVVALVRQGTSPGNDSGLPSAAGGTTTLASASTSPQRKPKSSSAFVDLGPDHEAAVHSSFMLVLRCVVSNPSLQPDMFATCSVVNFCVTEAALEEELLSTVVRLEKPDLEATRRELNLQMNRMTVSLRNCENLLLQELSSATGDVLENEHLVQTLEEAKKQSKELSASLDSARSARMKLNEALEAYRPIALRGCLMYMSTTDLYKVDPMYHYSIDLFLMQFERSVGKFATAINSKRQAAQEKLAAASATSQASSSGTAGATAATSVASPSSTMHRFRAEIAILEMTLQERLDQLLEVVTRDLFAFVSRSLFSDHKIVFAMTVALSVLQHTHDTDASHVNFFLRGSKKLFGDQPPKQVSEWLTKAQWENLHRLAELDNVQPPFRLILDECVDTSRWKIWCEMSAPESERLPGDWKLLTSFQKLLLVKTLRPDRLIAACRLFLADTFLGKCWAADYSGKEELRALVVELPRTSPILFLLTPGVDAEAQVHDAAALRRDGQPRRGGAKGLPPTQSAHRHVEVVSMGQNQEKRADQLISRAVAEGGWVLLHNVHLMKQWLPKLESRVQHLLVDGLDAVHPEFRLFLSCEPVDHVPSGLLQNTVKVVNESPSGLRSNFLRAYQLFAHEPWEQSTKPHEYHMTIYCLCYFHAVMVDRSKFGPVGWNRRYPFNTEDLLVCADVLATYLEERPRVPWEDLRYMFGDIMYGGHITDPWDRRLCLTYLSQFVAAEILERHEIAPGVGLPTSRNFQETLAGIEDMFPLETPALYQINPLSENRVRLREGRILTSHLVRTVAISARSSAVVGLSSQKASAMAAAAAEEDRIDDIALLVSAVPDMIPLDEVAERLGDERSPFHHVFYQECERMNRLVLTMQRSLDAAEAAVRGTQALSSDIDELLTDISCDRIPLKWAAHWGATKRPLAAWLQLVLEASKQLTRWSMELLTPKLINLSTFFVPIAVFGAVLQEASIRTGEALDYMGIVLEVTKRLPHQIDLHAREGCYIHGPSLEGAAWDSLGQTLTEATVKDGAVLPVLLVRAAAFAKMDRSDTYACPLYQTTDRGSASYVTTLHLRTKQPASTWVLRGTALILDAGY